MGLWLGALKNSEFFSTLGVSIFVKVSRTDWRLFVDSGKAKLSEWCAIICQRGVKATESALRLYEWPVKPALIASW